MGDLVARPVTTLVAAESRDTRALNKRTARILAYEDAEAEIRQRRIQNGCKLGARAARDLTILDGLVTELTHDNPSLELALRRIVTVVGLGSAELIADYITR